MTCKHCGTEIADKALVCYRCGHATAEPRVGPARAARPPSRVPAVAALTVLILTVLILGALFMTQVAGGEVPRLLSWTVAALAAIVLGWWLWRRRR
jgi:hypothetical protein